MQEKKMFLPAAGATSGNACVRITIDSQEKF